MDLTHFHFPYQRPMNGAESLPAARKARLPDSCIAHGIQRREDRAVYLTEFRQLPTEVFPFTSDFVRLPSKATTPPRSHKAE